MSLATEACEELRVELTKELKRLRREHYSNIEDIKTVRSIYETQARDVESIKSRQGLNDTAMATIFKVIRIGNALEA